jgi:hypothetical protein
MEMNMTNLLWFFAVILLAGGNGFGGLFGGRPMGPPPATQEDLTSAINNQTLQNQLSSLAVETANNNYETAQLLNQQSNLMQQQNNTNLINVIQGFNSVTQQLQNQTNMLAQSINQLGYQMDQCCCSIKTQMLQDRLTDKTAEAVALQNKLDNRDQTQTILGSLGRFVAWAGSGSQAATGAA